MDMNIGTVVALIKAMGGGADPAVIESAVQDWLDAHPEATTTVQDGSITEQKLATTVAQKLGLISSLSDEIVGIGSDVTNLKSALDDVKELTIETKTVTEEDSIKSELTWTPNYFMKLDGNPVSSATYSYSSMLNVKQGDVISTTSPAMRFITAFVNGSAVVSKGTQNVKTWTIPEGVTGIVISIETTQVGDNRWQIIHTHEETYYENILDEDVETLKSDVERIQDELDETVLHVYLPSEICVGVGRTIELYNNLVCLESEKYHMNWSCSVGVAYKRKFSVTGTSSNIGTYALTLNIYDDGMNLVKRLTSTVKIVDNNISDTVNIVPIGDSLTNQKPWEPEVQTLSNGKIAYIGTRQGAYAAYKHEGRSGATASWYNANITYSFDNNYVGNPQVAGNSNPFWDGSKFSLAHYIETQSSTIGTPDAIQILLGTNGMAIDPTSNVNNIKAIVDSITDEYPNMPIFVCNTIYRSNQDGYHSTGADGYVPVSDFQFSADVKVMNLQNALADTFANYGNVHIVPLSVCMDRDNDFGQVEVAVNPRLTTVTTHIASESVHPQNAGYLQMADTMYSSYIAHLT